MPAPMCVWMGAFGSASLCEAQLVNFISPLSNTLLRAIFFAKWCSEHILLTGTALHMAGMSKRSQSLERDIGVPGAPVARSTKRIRLCVEGVTVKIDKEDSIKRTTSEKDCSYDASQNAAPLLEPRPKACPPTVMALIPRSPSQPPPGHLRLRLSSWIGTFDWAHWGRSVNGWLQLEQTQRLRTSFSNRGGRWFQGRAFDEIVIEWTKKDGLVRHCLHSNYCDAGKVMEFQVVYCERLAFTALSHTSVEDKGMWKLDQNRNGYVTLGRRCSPSEAIMGKW